MTEAFWYALYRWMARLSGITRDVADWLFRQHVAPAKWSARPAPGKPGQDG